MGSIVAVGMSNTDLVCHAPHLPGPGETVAGSSLEVFAGGKGANQAVAASRAGAKVAFCGAAGDDAYGPARIQDLQAAGVDTSGVQTIVGIASGVAIIIVDENGENQIVTASGANRMVDSRKVLDAISDRSPDVVIMTWELESDTSRTIIRGLNSGTRIVLNLAPYGDSIRTLFPDPRLIVICNTVEALWLLGDAYAVDEAMRAAREIQSLGCHAAVVTLGARGAAGADAEHTWFVNAPAVHAVDTTGAGDAFCGAFAVWLADGSTLEDATRAGVAAGACAVMVAGAQPSMPVRAMIESTMREMAV